MRRALGFDIEERRRITTWTDALRLFIGQADEAGIMVMCSGVVLNNNYRPLDPDEFRGFALSDSLARLDFINGASGGNFYLTQTALVSKRFARALVISTLQGQTLRGDAFRMLGFAKFNTFQKLGRSLRVMA